MASLVSKEHRNSSLRSVKCIAMSGDRPLQRFQGLRPYYHSHHSGGIHKKGIMQRPSDCSQEDQFY